MKRFRREEHEREKREWEVKRRRQGALHKRLKEEKARVEALGASAEAWARSRRIREYLVAKEAAADPDDEALQFRFIWARDYADWFDP